MSDTNGFEIVKDFVPHDGRGSELGPISIALMAGETVFLLNAKQTAIGGRVATVKRRGYKIRTQKGEHNGVPGVYVWAEKPVPA